MPAAIHSSLRCVLVEPYTRVISAVIGASRHQVFAGCLLLLFTGWNVEPACLCALDVPLIFDVDAA